MGTGKVVRDGERYAARLQGRAFDVRDILSGAEDIDGERRHRREQVGHSSRGGPDFTQFEAVVHGIQRGQTEVAQSLPDRLAADLRGQIEGEVHGVGVALHEEADGSVFLLDQVVLVVQGVQHLHSLQSQRNGERGGEGRHFRTVDLAPAEQEQTRRGEEDRKGKRESGSPDSIARMLGD